MLKLVESDLDTSVYAGLPLSALLMYNPADPTYTPTNRFPFLFWGNTKQAMARKRHANPITADFFITYFYTTSYGFINRPNF
jgi:hypothetical protein